MYREQRELTADIERHMGTAIGPTRVLDVTCNTQSVGRSL